MNEALQYCTEHQDFCRGVPVRVLHTVRWLGDDGQPVRDASLYWDLEGRRGRRAATMSYAAPQDVAAVHAYTRVVAKELIR